MKKNFYASLLVALLCFVSCKKNYEIFPIFSPKFFINTISYLLYDRLNFFHANSKNNIILYLLFSVFALLLIFLSIQQHKSKAKKINKKIIDTKNLLNEIELYNKETKNKISDFLLEIKKELSFIVRNNKGHREKLNLIHNQIFFVIIVEIITKQKKVLKKINTLEAVNLYTDIERIQATGNIFILHKYISINNRWISDYRNTKKNIKHIIIKLKKGLYIEGITDLLLNELESIQKHYNLISIEEIKYRISTQLSIFQGKNSPKSVILIKNEINSIWATLQDYRLFENYWSYSKKYLTYYLQLSDFSNCIWELLYDLKKIKQQVNILSILKEINILTIEYKQNIDYINRENNLKIDKNIIKTLYAETNKKNKETARKINEYISLFYASISKSDFRLITHILKINNFKSQNAKILVLLLSDKKIKRTIIPGILDVYSNLNPIISRLINEKIRNNEKNIENFKVKKPFSVIAKMISDLLI